MGNPKQPLALLEAKGRTNLTKAEKEKRKKEEIKATPSTGKAPSYLNAEQKKIYEDYAEKLIALDIFADIDEWTLASFCKSFTQWRKAVRAVENMKIDTEDPDNIRMHKNLTAEQNVWFTQCRQLASDMGLNVTSRCKIVVPQKEEEPKNKFNRFLKEG